MKAVASSLRLRILRLCHQREMTNQELAERLDRDPSTILHHVRLLVEAGLLEPVGIRRGRAGGYEKPYRSTGLSWQLRFDRTPTDEDGGVDNAMLAAFRQELSEAGEESVAEFTRFYLHLDEEAAESFAARFKALVEEYMADNDERQESGHPPFGGVFVLHRMADDRRSS